MSLIDSDIERFDSIYDKVLQLRAERGRNIPARDEELIAEIIRNAEEAADEAEALKKEFGASVRFQAPANGSDKKKEYLNLDRYRTFEND